MSIFVSLNIIIQFMKKNLLTRTYYGNKLSGTSRKQLRLHSYIQGYSAISV